MPEHCVQIDITDVLDELNSGRYNTINNILTSNYTDIGKGANRRILIKVESFLFIYVQYNVYTLYDINHR